MRDPRQTWWFWPLVVIVAIVVNAAGWYLRMPAEQTLFNPAAPDVDTTWDPTNSGL